MECVRCGSQVWRDGAGTLIDNSGGDVCGVLGGNEPHSLDDDSVTSYVEVEFADGSKARWVIADDDKADAVTKAIESIVGPPATLLT
jgi:hypothetical protein